tara:strand:+ start:231 stop:482 length:252 start_codon:yes stop_codon:yes gene_type:complete
MAKQEDWMAFIDQDALQSARKARSKGVGIEWLGPDDEGHDTVTFDGEALNRDRFAYGAGVPSNKMRKPRASHPRHRDLMGRTA